MNKNIEDVFGKFAMLTAFIYLCGGNVNFLKTIIEKRDTFDFWPLAVLAQVFTIVFIIVAINFTVNRLPPRDHAAGIMKRVTAILGTYFMIALTVLPPEEIAPTQRIISTLMVIIGTIMSIWCLRQLGRSFSIMASSRELKTAGVYSIVRHPLYGAETVMMTGVAMGHGTLYAFAVYLVWIALQIKRAQNEESVLRKTFPEYDDYARRVPMLIPRFGRLLKNG